MSISIISNSAATFARKSLSSSTEEVRRSIAKISSGNRVFEAKEDASSLTIGTGLRLDAAVIQSATVNARTATSLMQIADGALSEIQDILDRMEGLSTMALSGQISSLERSFLDEEYQALMSEIDRIVQTTEFNGVKVLGGVNEVLLNTVGANVDSDNGFVGYSFDPSVDPTDTFQVSYEASTQTLKITSANTGVSQTIAVDKPASGFLNKYTFSRLGVTLTLNDQFDAATTHPHTGAGEELTVVSGSAASASVYEFQLGGGTDASDRIQVTIPLVNTSELGLSGSNMLTVSGAGAAKDVIQEAVDQLSTLRSVLGANLNRMDVAEHNLLISLENTESARSALLDTDIAEEMTTLATYQMIAEASTSMLAQANAQPQKLLRLLEG